MFLIGGVWPHRTVLSSFSTRGLQRLQVLNEVDLLAPLEILQELLVQLALQADFQPLLELFLGSAHFSDQLAERV